MQNPATRHKCFPINVFYCEEIGTLPWDHLMTSVMMQK